MRKMSFTKARQKMTEFADPVEKTLLTRQGEPVAVVMGIDAYRSQMALIELARDPKRYSKVMMAHLRVQQGDFSHTKDLDGLKKILFNV